jgi:hypothetical protein
VVVEVEVEVDAVEREVLVGYMAVAEEAEEVLSVTPMLLVVRVALVAKVLFMFTLGKKEKLCILTQS